MVVCRIRYACRRVLVNLIFRLYMVFSNVIVDIYDDREQYTRSNAATTRPLTSVRLAETLVRD